MSEFYYHILFRPELFYTSAILLLLIYALYYNTDIKSLSVLSIIILIVTLILNNNHPIYTNRNFIIDNLTISITSIILIGRILYFLLSISLLIEDLRYTYEYLILILTSILGMMLLVKSNDLIRMYLAIELQSMGMYILASYSRTKFRTEAGLKYYVMGGFASCIQLLGIRLVYGLLGTTNYTDILNLLTRNTSRSEGIIRGLILILSGLVFKLGAVPFHMWLPDVYHGSPLLSTSFFAILPKLSLFIRIFRIINGLTDLNGISDRLRLLVILSIIVGTIQALHQKNLKRLLAYSGISHVGFILIGASLNMWNASIFYLMVYMLMSVRMFRIIRELKRSGHKDYYKLSSLLEMNQKQPVLRLCLSIILFSMAGIPPLRGFFSKYYLLERALYRNNIMLGLVGILGSMIATVYYIQIIQLLYFYPTGNMVGKLSVMGEVEYVSKRSYMSGRLIGGSTLLLMVFLRGQDKLYIIVNSFLR
jgi:NADH-quinone oxidoreductase subunit N